MLPITRYQYRDQKHHWTKPKAKGRAKLASVMSIDGFMNDKNIGFPDLSNQTIIVASVIDQFTMRFPEAVTLQSE